MVAEDPPLMQQWREVKSRRPRDRGDSTV